MSYEDYDYITKKQMHTAIQNAIILTGMVLIFIALIILASAELVKRSNREAYIKGCLSTKNHYQECLDNYRENK